MKTQYRYYAPISGKGVPSVTELLPERQFFCTPEQLEKARTEGEDNHRQLEKGEGIFADVLQEIESRFGRIILQEQALFSKGEFFAGTPDIVTEKAIIDLKRSFYSERYHALQLAGYNQLTRDNDILNTSAWFILTIEDGKPRFRPVFNQRADLIFSYCVQEFQLKRAVQHYLKEVA
jgi:hypothetical protein